MAAVLFGVRVLDAPGLGTFAVDPHWRMYVDFDAVSEWGAEGCAQVFLHECGHLLLDHANRARATGVGEADRSRWNIAADMEWNDDLVAAGCGFVAETGQLPKHYGLNDADIAERYYAALERQAPPQSGGGGCGSGSGGNVAECEIGAGEQKAGGHVGDALSETDKQLARIAVAASVREHAMSKGRGSVPAGLVEWSEAILAPAKIPWQRVLSGAIKRSVAIRMGDLDVTYLRRNRRRPTTLFSAGRKVVNPGWCSPIPSIVVVRDTSGSMSTDDMAVVGAEIEGIAKQIGIRGENLRVLDVDASAHGVRRYTGSSSIREVRGRGGTDMGAGIDAALDLRPVPTTIVVITDGYTPWPAEKPHVPVVVCLVGGGESWPEGPSWAASVHVPTD